MNVNKQIYLDYQATTPVAREVVDAMLPYFTENFGNPHSTQHEVGRASSAAVEQARKKVATMINAEPHEIIFTSGATESNNLAIKSIAKNYFDQDVQIITCITEHKCVLESCHSLEKEGYDVKYLKVDQDGLINLEDLENLLKQKKSLVSIMHVNNEIGIIQPIEQIGLMCNTYDSIFHTDAAQTFSCLSIDVKKDCIAALSLSAHKFYGPKGIGALYIRSDVKNTLRPILDGGGQEQGIRSGTLPTPLVVGLGKACDLAAKNHIQRFEHPTILQRYFLNKLKEHKIEYDLNGSFEKRIPINLNIALKNKSADEIIMGQNQFAISSGSACTTGNIEKSHVIAALNKGDENLNNSFRISFGEQTTTNDLDRFIKLLKS